MSMFAKRECPVCSGEAKISRDIDPIVCCKRCGDYQTTMIGLVELEHRPEEERKIISGILRNRWERGETTQLMSETGDPVKMLLESTRAPESPFEKIDLLLEHVMRKAGDVSKAVTVDRDDDYPLIYANNPKEFLFYLKQAEELGYIKQSGVTRAPKHLVQLSLEGWRRLDSLRRERPDSEQVFVAMWFDEGMDEVYEEGIQPAILKTGLEPLKINLKEYNGKIDDEIVAEIRRSGLLIADVTGHRQGVYFEAGLAMGLNMPVIWTCREDEIEKAHFDTRQYNHIVWRTAEELKKKLVDRIRATILI